MRIVYVPRERAGAPPEGQQAAASAGMYALFSRLMLQAPDTVVLRALRDDVLPALEEECRVNPGAAPLCGATEALRAMLPADETELEALCRRLRTEFTELLRGIRKGGVPPPYESVYRGEGMTFGSVTVRVRREYASRGLSPEGEYSGEPPDHLGIELAYLEHLCSEAARAWEEGNRAQAGEMLTARLRFILDHPGGWVGSLRERVAVHDATGFYTQVLGLIEGWLEMETAGIDLDEPLDG